ncbi:MAG: 5-(carboxyamino)imidazole ribonucleotide synthase [Cyanobacteria bacterium J06559_3]
MTQPVVGIVGGGQLAWMMALEAKALGIKVIVQTPAETDPAVAAAKTYMAASASDPYGTMALTDVCDVITFENEFIDLEALRKLEVRGALFRPSIRSLEPLLDKYTQRQFLVEQDLPNPPYMALDETTDHDRALTLATSVGFPLVMKTRRLGYDGQGTFIIRTPAALQQTWQQINHPPVLLEAFIPFEKELAVMVARSHSGGIVVYPVVETQQVDQVCRRVIAPATISTAVEQAVTTIARTLIERLDFVGILGIELFLAPGDKVLINEVAPRTHNSGHYTLDACATSQFAQQLLAATGRPLGSPQMTCDRALMVNLLGFEDAEKDYADQRQQLAQMPNARVYWYNKQASRPGRKLGHVTVCLDAEQDWEAIASVIESIWYPAE